MLVLGQRKRVLHGDLLKSIESMLTSAGLGVVSISGRRVHVGAVTEQNVVAGHASEPIDRGDRQLLRRGHHLSTHLIHRAAS